MRPLTEDTPKPLLPAGEKTIIEHNIDLVKDEVEEIIIVGGYRIEDLKQKFSDRADITIVEQEKALGTAHAALQAQELIDEKTVVMNGDDIYGEKALEALKFDSAVLASRVDDPEKFGVFQLKNGKISGLVEKPDNPSSNLVNIGFYVVQPEFFDLLEDVEKSERGEYEITDAINSYIKNHEVEFVEANQWLPCSYPFQLVEASQELTEGQKIYGSAEVDESVDLVGDVFIGDDVEVEQDSEIRDSVVNSEASVKGKIEDSVVLEGAEVDADVENAIVRKDSVVKNSKKSSEIEIIGDKE